MMEMQELEAFARGLGGLPSAIEDIGLAAAAVSKPTVA